VGTYVVPTVRFAFRQRTNFAACCRWLVLHSACAAKFNSANIGTPSEICTPMAVNRRVLSAVCLLFHQQGTENLGDI
jgi:hypothetical protein